MAGSILLGGSDLFPDLRFNFGGQFRVIGQQLPDCLTALPEFIIIEAEPASAFWRMPISRPCRWSRLFWKYLLHRWCRIRPGGRAAQLYSSPLSLSHGCHTTSSLSVQPASGGYPAWRKRRISGHCHRLLFRGCQTSHRSFAQLVDEKCSRNSFLK